MRVDVIDKLLFFGRDLLCVREDGRQNQKHRCYRKSDKRIFDFHVAALS